MGLVKYLEQQIELVDLNSSDDRESSDERCLIGMGERENYY